MSENAKKALKWVGSYAAVAAILFLVYYITLPAINWQSEGFWFFLAFAIFLCVLPFVGLRQSIEVLQAGQKKKKKKHKEELLKNTKQENHLQFLKKSKTTQGL